MAGENRKSTRRAAAALAKSAGEMAKRLSAKKKKQA